MALRALIADDEPLARARLRRLIAACRNPEVLVVGEAPDADQVEAQIRRTSFDLILLDIGMPGGSGLEIAEALRVLAQPPFVVFVTAHPGHALRAFDLDAVDYLTKPVRLQRLEAALCKVERLAAARRALAAGGGGEPQALMITAPGLLQRVALSEVLYLKAELKYVTVGTARGNFLFDGSLNQLEEQYPDRFLRIHRNALVARAAVEALQRRHAADGVESWVVRLSGLREEFAVSRRQIPAVRAALGHPVD